MSVQECGDLGLFSHGFLGCTCVNICFFRNQSLSQPLLDADKYALLRDKSELPLLLLLLTHFFFPSSH